jgi:hypothetical protein
MTTTMTRNETPQIGTDLTIMPEAALTPTTSAPIPQDRMTFGKELLVVPSGTVIPGDQPATLSRCVVAGVERTGDGVVIDSVLFDEDGYGWSYEAAWHDFLTSLRDRYASLSKRESTLSEADRKVLEHLRGSIAFSS